MLDVACWKPAVDEATYLSLYLPAFLLCNACMPEEGCVVAAAGAMMQCSTRMMVVYFNG